MASLFAGDLALPTGIKTLTLAPGDTWRGNFSLGDLVELGRFGEYKLDARIEWEGRTMEAERFTFTIEGTRMRGLHIGLGERPFDDGQGQGAFLQAGEGVKTLFSFDFSEEDPGLGEMHVEQPIRRLTLSSGVSDVLVPWRDAPFFSEMLQWILWRNGNRVEAVSSMMSEPVGVDLPFEAASLVRPALKPSNQSVEVIALSKSGKALAVVQIGDGRTEAPGQPGILFTTTLPEPPDQAVAALAPASAGGKRHLALVFGTKGGVDLHTASYAPGAGPGDFVVQTIPGARLIDGAPPAMLVHGDGSSRVGLFAMQPSGEIQFIKVRLTPDGTPAGRPVIQSLPPPKSPIIEASLLYAAEQGVLERRLAALRSQDGTLLRLHAPNNGDWRLEPFVTSGPVTSPMAIVPGKSGGYIIIASPDEGIGMEPF